MADLFRFDQGWRFDDPRVRFDTEVPPGLTPNTPLDPMSQNNRVSIVITPEALASALAKITESEAALPALLTLTEEEARELIQVGDQMPAFNQAAQPSMESKPQFVPGYVTTAEVRKDFNVFDPINQIIAALDAYKQRLLDTRRRAGHEMHDAHLAYYHRCKDEAERGTPGAQAVVDLLEPLRPNRRRGGGSSSGSGGGGTPP